MVLSSGDTLTGTTSDVLPAIWASLGLIELTEEMSPTLSLLLGWGVGLGGHPIYISAGTHSGK